MRVWSRGWVHEQLRIRVLAFRPSAGFQPGRLGKLASTVKARPQIRTGWLTPLLALFVLLDVTGFWSIVWDARDAIPASYGVLVIALAITGLYYFAASLIFPSNLDAEVDLDLWYFDHKSTVFAILLAC